MTHKFDLISKPNQLKLPNFLIIGVQKAGTTWLHSKLKEHPDIFLPQRKELEFFSRTFNFNEVAINAYIKEFESCTHEICRGEATPSYFFTYDPNSLYQPKLKLNHNIPKNVLSLLGPDLKLLLSFRHPVDRAISAFFHHIRKGRIECQQSIFDVATLGGLLDAGFYARHLQNWLKYYSLDNFHFVTLEQINIEPQFCYDKILKFLGVTNKIINGDPQTIIHKGIERIKVGELIAPKGFENQGPFICKNDIEKLFALYHDDLDALEQITGITLRSNYQIS
jgi:hypothetical protein